MRRAGVLVSLSPPAVAVAFILALGQGSASAKENDGVDSATSSGILLQEAGDRTLAFIAPPGTYVLHLHVTATGSCFQNEASFLNGSLTYILIGTTE